MKTRTVLCRHPFACCTGAIALSAICLLLSAGTAFCRDIQIAVVDIPRVVRAHPDIKTAEGLLTNEREEFEAENKEMLEKLEQLKNETEAAHEEAQNRALSELAREMKMEIAKEKLAELQKQDIAVRKTVRKRKLQIADHEKRMLTRIVAKVEKIIAAYAKEKGFDFVLNSAQIVNSIRTVVYCSESADITADVLKLVGEEEAPGD